MSAIIDAVTKQATAVEETDWTIGSDGKAKVNEDELASVEKAKGNF